MESDQTDIMLLQKPQEHVSFKRLWQYEQGDPEVSASVTDDETVLLFGLFYVDKFMNSNVEYMSRLMTKLQSHVEDWNAHYPWSDFNGIDFRLNEMQDGSYAIMGQLIVEEHAREEEALIVALLQDFSVQAGPYAFIRICDTDGDFILMECNDALPEEYEYPHANNRLWLHEGRFKMIPKTFRDTQGLRPEEALLFLKTSSFKLTEIENLSISISKNMINGFPEKYLSNLKRLPLTTEDEKLSKVLKANPQIGSLLIRNLLRKDVQIPKVTTSASVESLELLVPQRHCDMLSLFLREEDVREEVISLPLYVGRALCIVLTSLLQSEEIFLREREPLLKKDTKESQFSSFKFSYFEPNFEAQPDEDASASVNILEQLAKAFKEDTQSKGLDEDQPGDEYTDEEGKADESCKKYFEDEKIDIDEDDFFEFFMKEALKMGKENIESLKSSFLDDFGA